MKTFKIKILFIVTLLFASQNALFAQRNSNKNDIYIDCTKPMKIQEKKNIFFGERGLEKSIKDGYGYLISNKIRIPIKNFEPYLSFTIKSKVENLDVENFTLFVRTSKKGIKWSEWDTLIAVDDANQSNEEGGNQNFYICNTPISKLKAKLIQYKVEIKDINIVLKSLQLHFFSPGIIKNKMQENTFQSPGKNCPCPPVSYISRTAWACLQSENCPVFDPNSNSNVTFPVTNVTNLVVHHAAGYGNPPYDARLRDIWDLHVNVNGWSDIAYNWIIAPDGVIYKGRAWNGNNDNVVGAHMCACNSNKMGICLLGNFTNTLPTSTAYASLVGLLGWKACSWGINPVSSSNTSHNPNSTGCSNGILQNIIGHRDGCQQSPLYTTCPGNAFYPQLANLRVDVLNFINNCNNIPCNDNFEPNDNCTSATPVFAVPLGNGNSNYTPSGTTLGFAGDQDWYKIQLTECGTLSMTLSNLPKNYNIELYGAICSTQFINGSYNSGTNNDQIVFSNTSSGITTLYAKVYSNDSSDFSPSICYHLNFQWLSSGVNPAVAISASPSASICYGQTVTFTATPYNGGISPFYQWFLNNLPIGNNNISYSDSSLTDGAVVYCIMTSNENCVSTTSATSNNINLNVSSFPKPVLIFSNDSIIVTNISGSQYNYQWYYNGSLISTDTSYILCSGSGDYNLIITLNGCSDTSDTININCSLGFNNILLTDHISVYPNPAEENIQIRGNGLNNGIITLSLTNILGQQLIREFVKISNHSIELNLNLKDIVTGIYVLTLTSENKNQRIKILKQ